MTARLITRHLLAIWLGALLSSLFSAIGEGAEETLYLLEASPDPLRLRQEGIILWDHFRLGERQFAVVAVEEEEEARAAGARAQLTELGAAEPSQAPFIVTARRGLDLNLISRLGRVVIHDDSVALVLIDRSGADRLAAEGNEIRAVLPPPRKVTVPKAVPPAARPGWDQGIQDLIDAVQGADVWEMLGYLSGENGVTIGGDPYTIRTRNSYQEVPIARATQYCLEYFQNLGLEAEFHDYMGEGNAWRNVVAVQPGRAHPENIYIICAHLDDLPEAPVAPGADDNASGSTAVLLAATVLSRRQFENTIRYVLFTGEEQGLIGSYHYVQELAAGGDYPLGTLNFDMIAYDGDDDRRIEVHCGTLGGSEAIGDLFIDTIDQYSLDLDPVKLTYGSTEDSDQARFWNAGYPAILGIEDTEWDFNPNYHTANDTRANCVPSYATIFVKAAVGTVARQAVLLATPVSSSDSGDYNGDGTSDIAIFRGSAGMWSVRNLTRIYFGNPTDYLVPADYNGDSTTDVAIFRGSSGMWSVRGLSRFYLGVAGDVPVPGDYVGNGTATAGLFRASGGLWAIRNVTRAYFGASGDSVVPGYYNADDAKDIASFRGSSGMWSVRGLTRFYFGSATDKLAPGDYNGTGKWEGAIFRPSSGMWSIRNATRFYLGNSTDSPAPADYDGNEVDDAGIFRDSSGMWAVRNLSRVYFGATGDMPVTR